MAKNVKIAVIPLLKEGIFQLNENFIFDLDIMADRFNCAFQLKFETFEDIFNYVKSKHSKRPANLNDTVKRKASENAGYCTAL